MFGRSAATIPDGVPLLSRGRHRNPRKGACFMEFASYLSGQRWSDHPSCTHPLLASMARCINDAIDDDYRQQLVHLVPEVVGLHPTSVRVVPTLVREAALAAIPVAAAEVQNVMALALLTTERTLAELDGRPTGALSPEVRAALDDVPASERWARRYLSECGLRQRAVRAGSAAAVTSLAITGIASACTPDADARLVRLLHDAVAATQRVDRSSATSPAGWAPGTATEPAPSRERMHPRLSDR